MSDEYDSWRRYEDAKVFKNKLAEIGQLKAEIDMLKNRIEKLEAVTRDDAKWLAAYHQWCKMNGCAPSSSDLIAASEALNDRPVYKEGYRAVEEAMGHPSPEFWVERK
jgi:hypothetical protein